MTADRDKQARILTPSGDGAAGIAATPLTDEHFVVSSATNCSSAEGRESFPLMQFRGAGGLAHPTLIQRFQFSRAFEFFDRLGDAGGQR
jgi:hypothetical protein